MKKLICFAVAIAAGIIVLLSHASAQTGSASWYALDGRMTANGERMNSRRMTAAHRRLPFGTRIRVTNLRNGKSVVVRVNDRGPFAKGRVLDVSKAAARRLGFLGRGHTRVKISVVGKGKKSHRARSKLKKRSAFVAPITIPTRRPAITLASLGFPNYY